MAGHPCPSSRAALRPLPAPHVSAAAPRAHPVPPELRSSDLRDGHSREFLVWHMGQVWCRTAGNCPGSQPGESLRKGSTPTPCCLGRRVAHVRAGQVRSGRSVPGGTLMAQQQGRQAGE